MRVLLISQFFDPEPTLKGLTFAKGIAAQGNQVRVLTGFPNYPSGRISAGYRLRAHQRESVDSVVIDRVALYPSHDASPVRRSANYLSFSASSTAWQGFSRWKPDVVWVHHPPISAAAAALITQWRWKVPFVLEIQDLWPDSLSETGMVGDGRLLKAVGSVTSRVYRRASRVITISEGMQDSLVTRGVPREKTAVIPNWADEHRLSYSSEDTQWARRICTDHSLNVVFAGNAGPAQGLDSLLEAVHLVRHRVPHLRLLIVGGGLDEPRLRARAKSLGLAQVLFVDRQPMSRIGALLSIADVAVVHLKRTPLFDITIPSKTQAYMACGVPILMAVAGEGARLVSEAGCGLTAIPEDPHSIAEALVNFDAVGPSRRQEMGRSGQEYYRGRLSRTVGLSAYDELFRRMRTAGDS